MPAVTVADPSVLPVVPPAGAGAGPPRAVVAVSTAPHGYEGEGFPVRRAFAGVDLDLLDPFIHLDQMGEVEYAPGEPKGTAWHPHRGFETVTYMIDGQIEHQDSTGGGGLIADGATQWMTAGSGILHIERPPEAAVVAGGLFHGLQLWVNLPATAKLTPPRYQDIGAGLVTLVASPDGGALVRVIAGRLGTHGGPGATHTPITMVHATLEPGARVELPWPEEFNALAYVLNGRGVAGRDGVAVGEGQLAVFGSGGSVVLSAAPRLDSRARRLDVIVLGGRPIREPVAWYGPFVMNTRQEIAQAVEDFSAGRMGTIPAG